MKKHVLIIGLGFFLATIGLAQEAGRVRTCLTYDISGRISQDEIEQFHEFILKIYNECAGFYSYHDTISFLDIYRVRLEGIPFDCKIIENGDFLNYLVPDHVSKKWFRWKKHGIKAKVRNLLLSRSILFHDETPFMEFWNWEWPKLYEDDVRANLLQVVKQYNIVSLYDLKDMSVQGLLGVDNDKNVFIIRVRYFNKTISVFPAKEFIDDELPVLFPDNNYKSKWNCSKK